MDHVAIMNPSWKLIPKILSGEKTIESRWYQTRRAPWKKVQKGDRIFFKDSGKMITATATIAHVECIELSSKEDVESVITKYGKQICLVQTDIRLWGKLPKYCILVWLKEPKSIHPFSITKAGFGSGVAWISVKNIDTIKI